jgi:four helix bundle protein
MLWRDFWKEKVKSKKAKEKSGGTMSKTPKDIKERAFEFALRIIKLFQHLDKKPGVPRTLSYQLLKAGTSVGANIEEAQAGQSRPDFISKNSIALKEARECHYWLRLLIAAKIMPEKSVAELRDEADEIKRILGSIVIRTKTRTV